MSGENFEEFKGKNVNKFTAGGNIKSLQDTWTNAYDCWINPAPFVIEAKNLENEKEAYSDDTLTKCAGINVNKNTRKLDEALGVELELRIYMSPVSDHTRKITYGFKPTWPVVNLKNKVIYALTGTNPMGIETNDETNQAANEALERRIKNLAEELNGETSNPFHLLNKSSSEHLTVMRRRLEWWHGFGFSKTWKEHGFILMFDHDFISKQGNTSFDIVYRLAADFKQGAVYEYKLVDVKTEVNVDVLGSDEVTKHDTNRDNISGSTQYVLKRWTRGICMEVTPDDVTLELITKPDFLS